MINKKVNGIFKIYYVIIFNFGVWMILELLIFLLKINNDSSI